MARIVSSGRLLSSHVSVPADFYRQEFIRHRECLAQQREVLLRRGHQRCRPGAGPGAERARTTMRLRQRRPVDRIAAPAIQRGHQPVGLVGSQTASLRTASHHTLRGDALRILRAGVDAVAPGPLIASALSSIRPGQRPRFVVAAGKAAAGMLRAALPLLDVDRAVLASHDAAALDDRRVATFTAGHPSPNRESVRAAERALALAAESRRSRRAARAAVGWRLGDARRARGRRGSRRQAGDCAAADARRRGDRRAELRAQAPVAHQGRPAGAAAGTTVTLALSDVHAPDRRRSVGDRFRTDGGRPHDLCRCGGDRRELPSRASGGVCAITSPPALRGAAEETIKAGDPRIESSIYTVVGNRQTAVDGARRAALDLGYDVIVVDEVITGEASRAGEAFVSAALRRRIGAAASGLCAGIWRDDRHGSRQRFGWTESGVRARERGGVERRAGHGASSSAAPERMASTARRQLRGPWSTGRRSSGPAPWA